MQGTKCPFFEMSTVGKHVLFHRLPRTCRHKLSTSFAVMVVNEATVLQTSFDGLSLISSVAILSRLLLSVYISCGYAHYQFSGLQGFDSIQ